MLSKLRIAKYRFRLRALEGMRLPKYKGGTLRGGFGSVLKRIVCFQERAARRDCSACLLKANCPYVYIFESLPPPDAGPIEVSDAPRPFVIEPPLDGKTVYEAGEVLAFDLVLIGRGINYLPYFIIAFRELGRTGLGREQGRYGLERVGAVHPLTGETMLLYDAEDGSVRDCDLSVGYAEVEEVARRLAPNRLTVRFLTPSRLKYRGQLVTGATFHVLLRSCLRRISWLYHFHCGERWEADYPGLVETAEGIETALMDTRWVDWGRYSRRQRRHMNVGGFVGRVEYRGDLALFLPIILLGSVLHVGKLCSFGHGKYEILQP